MLRNINIFLWEIYLVKQWRSLLKHLDKNCSTKIIEYTQMLVWWLFGWYTNNYDDIPSAIHLYVLLFDNEETSIPNNLTP